MGRKKTHQPTNGHTPAPVPSTEEPRSGFVVAFYCLSFLSGAAALIYEITWAKMLSLSLGSTTLAAAVVVAGFMGGMGLGAWLYHLVLRRFNRPVLLYALLELGIAASAGLLTLTFYSLPELFASLSGVAGTGFMLVALRFLIVFGLLFLPAALMGATYPALCSVLIRSAPGVDRHLGVIYGLNTIGAAVGVLVGGVFLIQHLGLGRTVLVGNALNVTVGVITLLLAGRRSGNVQVAERPPDVERIATMLPRALTGCVLLVSGFTTLAYEVLWFRLLRYTVGNSTHALTAILFVFLLGLGVGSLLLRGILRRCRPEKLFVLCQCGIAVFALGAIGMQTLLLSEVSLRKLVSIFEISFAARPWHLRLLMDVLAATVTVFPAAVCMGLSFTLGSRLYLGNVKRLSSRVGAAYMLASLGGVFGAVTTATIALPLVGTFTGTKLLMVLNIGCAAILCLYLRGKGTSAYHPFRNTLVVLLVLLVITPGRVPFRGEDLDPGVPGIVTFQREGDVATVQIVAHPNVPDRRAMFLDGYGIGWDIGFGGITFYRKQLMLAHLPMVLDPDLTRTLNVGLGSSITLSALSKYPRVESLDCVEISKSVVEASRYFTSSDVLADKRTNLIIDDAINFLLRTDQTYDLIVSDGKQNLGFSGNATLLCKEFYEFAAKRMSQRGLLIQWLPVSMLSEEVAINLRTMCRVFPHVELFFEPIDSIFVVASKSPILGREVMTDDEYRGSSAFTDLSPFDMPTVDAVLGRWTAGDEQLRAVLGAGPVSTWDRLYLDFTSFTAEPREWSFASSENMVLLLTAASVPRVLPGKHADLRERPYSQSATLIRHAYASLYSGSLEDARAWAAEAVNVNPGDEGAEKISELLSRAQSAADLYDRGPS